MRVFIPLLAPFIFVGAAFAQEAPLAKIYACADMPKADERLACFDAAVAGLKQAAASGDVAVVSREQVAEAERQAFGLARPSVAEVAGAAQPALDRVEVTIASFNKQSNGLLRYTLSDGQVWEEFDKSLGKLREIPAKAEIRKGLLGAFMMKVEGRPLVRVRRVQ